MFLPAVPTWWHFSLKYHAGGDAWNNIIVVLNGSRDDRQVTVPEGYYTIVAQDGKIDQGGITTLHTATINVAAQSAIIMHN